jgi:hypothetical protein
MINGSKFCTFVHALNGSLIFLIDDLALQLQSGGQFAAIDTKLGLKHGKPLYFLGIRNGLCVCCIDAGLDGF